MHDLQNHGLRNHVQGGDDWLEGWSTNTMMWASDHMVSDADSTDGWDWG